MTRLRRSVPSLPFDVPAFLQQMHVENRQDHRDLVKKVDEGFAAVATRAEQIAKELAAHATEDAETSRLLDLRLQTLERPYKSLRWAAGGLILAAFGSLTDLLFNHVPHWLAYWLKG